MVYAYLKKIYASLKIAKVLREDINFLWLSGMSRFKITFWTAR
jgi:transposase